MATALWASGTLEDYFRERLRAASSVIEGWNPDELLTTSENDVVEYLYSSYRIELPQLDPNSIELTPPTDITIKRQGYDILERPRRGTVQGTRLQAFIPYAGDARVFSLAPNPFLNAVVEVTITEGHLIRDIEGVDLTRDQVHGEIDRTTSRIQKNLDYASAQVNEYHDRLRKYLAAAVDRRKKKILRDRDLETSLGYRIRKRADAGGQTVPVKRKRIAIPKPSPSGGTFQPEPYLEIQHYEEIIRSILSMGNGFERSPTLFSNLTEEGIRDNILLHLNANYQGEAAAEMFNGEGKTDILVRKDDRNVFIAECKIWSGAKNFSLAIDQLLGYLVWRDTKAALILFIKNRDVTATVEKADAVIRTHPNFKNALASQEPERRQDYIIHQTGDINREIHVALLPMPVPASLDS